MKQRNYFFTFIIAIFLIVSGCASTTPLIKASTKGDSLAVQTLIESGADINEPDSNGYTPLMNAIWSENTEIVKALINKGADINAKDKNGYTAFLHSDNYEIAKLLVDNGADVNVQDNKGMTKLHLVAQAYGDKNAFRIAEYLLDKNANTTVKDKKGWTAFRYAIYSKNINMVALLRKKTGTQEVVESLTLPESLGQDSLFKPEEYIFDVPTNKEQNFKIALDDCNLLIFSTESLSARVTKILIFNPDAYKVLYVTK
jgi:hypothetical protein